MRRSIFAITAIALAVLLWIQTGTKLAASIWGGGSFPCVGGIIPPADMSCKFRFRWPVEGRIISRFGLRADGSHNDGIDIATSLGAQVRAVDYGVVAYAGSELKGYGNLILVRHTNNWVSVYAHNDQLLVHEGDKVHPGEVIAKAGHSGSVDKPQLHFELRKGSKLIDPLLHLAGRSEPSEQSKDLGSTVPIPPTSADPGMDPGMVIKAPSSCRGLVQGLVVYTIWLCDGPKLNGDPLAVQWPSGTPDRAGAEENKTGLP